MTTIEYNEACHALGLTPSGTAAAALGISRMTAHRYATGQRKIDSTVALLLDVLMTMHETRPSNRQVR